MGTFIWYELKQKLAHPKTWFMIIIIFIFSFQMIGDYRAESIRDPVEERLKRTAEFAERTAEQALNILILTEGSEISKKSAQKWIDTGTEMRAAIRRGDYVEWNRLNSFHNLIQSKGLAQNFGSNRDERLRMLEEEALKIWNDVSGGISYEQIDFINGLHGTTSMYKTFLKFGQYYHILFQNELMPINRYHIDSFTFVYHYLNEIVPLLLGFLILIMVFDSINHQWSNGSLKLLLTQPFSRKKYLLSKGVIGVLHTLFIILIPVIVIFLGLGITGGFENYNYPVIFLEGGFTSLSPIPNTSIESFGEPHLGISNYNVDKVSFAPHPQLTFMPLYQFLILGVILLILCIMFYVSINILISSMTKNKMVGFTIGGITTLVGIAISQRWVHGEKYNLSPFTMNNPVRILNGTYNVTALTAVIVLCLAIILVTIANVGYFKRKDL